MSTIVAISTASGRGGIGILRLSGPDALAMAQKLCHAKKDYLPRYAHYVNCYDAKDALLDSGLVLYFPAPHSYTGEEVVEFQGHGSPVLMQALFSRLLELGAEAALPGEFTRRAVDNNKMDLSQAEAVAACIDAATLRAARQAQRHLQGDFGRKLDSLMQEMTRLVAHLEACLDFPEDEVPDMLFDQIRQDVESNLLTPMTALLGTSNFGERLFDGATVAIVGSPNVGKSSLFNALSGRERAIVSTTAGTTRDVLEMDFSINGIPLRLLDTAGIRQTDDFIEKEGVSRAMHAAEDADLVIFMADVSRPESWESTLRADVSLMNKVDTDSTINIPSHFMPISVHQGTGLQTLADQLAELLGDMPAHEEGILLCNARHRQLVETALQHLKQGLQYLGREEVMELVALEWRQAWSALGEILGIGDVEHILDHVFSSFCIGK
ncbi:MAG: tRNA uridine-5-carboxymethylaminomethyl(34) synthesis GTPase MnmE [Mariprofundaceae bacterium]|nr:tRNA uridine-5-carboxymethylaminomethyl(34) synthesis GTPase MnmE [Mariprofundaceae bacterium]